MGLYILLETTARKLIAHFGLNCPGKRAFRQNKQIGFVATFRHWLETPPTPVRLARPRIWSLLESTVAPFHFEQEQCPLRDCRRHALLPFSVRFWASVKHRRNGCRLAAVMVLLTLWAAMFALEVSPRLHQTLHKDAQSPGHNCLVTKLQQGLVESGYVAAFALPPPQTASYAVNRPDSQYFPSYDYRLAPSRGPPSV